MHALLGTCSECFGPVGLKFAWYSKQDQVATCFNCGAVALLRLRYGALIHMEPLAETKAREAAKKVNPETGDRE